MARGLLCFGRRRHRSRACVMIWNMAIQAYRMLSKLVWPRFMLPNGAHTRPQGESGVAAVSQARPPPGRPPLGATSSAPSAPPAGAAGVPALLLFKVPTAQVTSTAMRPEHMASASLSGTMYDTLLTAPSVPARAPEKSGAPHLLAGGSGSRGSRSGQPFMQLCARFAHCFRWVMRRLPHASARPATVHLLRSAPANSCTAMTPNRKNTKAHSSSTSPSMGSERSSANTGTCEAANGMVPAPCPYRRMRC